MCGRSPRCVAEAAISTPASRRKNCSALEPMTHRYTFASLALAPRGSRPSVGLEQIQIERPAQAAIGADHDDADGLHRPLEVKGCL